MTAPTASFLFDPFAPDVVEDPYPAYRTLVERFPVYHQERLDVWVLSRYADVARAARAHEQLSSAEGVTFLRTGLPMILTLDPPGHTRLRKLVTRDFAPRGVERWREVVQALARTAVDEVVRRRSADAVEVLAAPFPIAVIASILGIPAEDRDRFKSWSDGVVEGFNLTDPGDFESGKAMAVLDAINNLRAYFLPLFEERRGRPSDDLLSKLLHPDDPDALSDEELFWFCFLLLVAGNETTTNLLGNMLSAFIANPDQWELLRNRRDLIPSAVEEALRFESPIQGFYRTATQDFEVGGTRIPKGGRVLLLFGAANRDPERYNDPDSFLVERNPDDHLAFGAGIHFCLGANLARMEAALVLDELLTKVTSIRLDGDVVRTTNPTVRGLARMPIHVTPI